MAVAASGSRSTAKVCIGCQHGFLPRRTLRRRGAARLQYHLTNGASLLRLASAVLSEIDDDRETERAYLNMEAR